MVLLEKSETLDKPEAQEQIKRALATGKVLALPVGSCNSQILTKARSLGGTLIVSKACSKYGIMDAIKKILLKKAELLSVVFSSSHYCLGLIFYAARRNAKFFLAHSFC